jgi:hypothetical protein
MNVPKMEPKIEKRKTWRERSYKTKHKKAKKE